MRLGEAEINSSEVSAPLATKINQDNIMLYTFKIYPSGWGRIAYRVMEVGGDKSFDSLAMDILAAFNFGCNHLYEFRNTLGRSDRSIIFNPNYDNFNPLLGFIGGNDSDTADEYNDPCPDRRHYDSRRPIKFLNPEKSSKFYFHYDFCDDWIFVIHVSKVEADKPSPDHSNVIKSVGKVGGRY